MRIFTLSDDELWQQLHESEVGADGVRDALTALIKAKNNIMRAHQQMVDAREWIAREAA